jgi:hypothetical protein
VRNGGPGGRPEHPELVVRWTPSTSFGWRGYQRAEEFRLKAMRRTPRRIPEHLVPLAGTRSDSPPLRVADRYADGRPRGR